MTEENQTAPEAPATVVADAAQPATPAVAGSSSPALRGFLGGLLGGVAVLALLAVGLVASWPLVKQRVLGGDDQRLAVLEASLGSLSQRVSSLDGQHGDAAALGSLSQRIAALEAGTHAASVGDSRATALAQKSEQASADIARLTGEVDHLRRAMPPEGTILRLAERAELAEKAVREVAIQQRSAQALLLVVGQLREAIDRADPYDVELRAARRIAPVAEAAEFDALAPFAATGVPRKIILLEEFQAVATLVVQASIVPDGDSFWQRGLHKLTSLVSLRRVDGQGSDTAAIVARAEARAHDGDLAKAVEEMAALQGAPADAAAVWTKQAAARVAVDRVLSQLAATAAAETAKSGG